jgi:hypothetical protein
MVLVGARMVVVSWTFAVGKTDWQFEQAAGTSFAAAAVAAAMITAVQRERKVAAVAAAAANST